MQELADSYVSGTSDISSDDFVTQYQEKRTLYWLRKVRAEKMEELLKNIQPVAAPRSPRPRASVPAPYVAPMSHSLPVSTHHHPSYPQGPAPPGYSHVPNPAQSIHPYHHQAPTRMPMPQPGVPPQGHPFNPAASYARYPGQMPYPPRPVPPYGSYHANRY